MSKKKSSKKKSAEILKVEAELNDYLNRAIKAAIASVYPPKKKATPKRSPSKPKPKVKVMVMVPPQPEFDFSEIDAS